MKYSSKPRTSDDHPHARPSVSLGRALGAGLAASLLNSVAIQVTTRTGIPPGTGGLSRMVLAQLDAACEFLGLALLLPVELGPWTQLVFHTSVGTGMAMVYVLAFQRWLPGPQWFRGLLFCQIAWSIQAFVVLPYLGAGPMGRRLSPMTPWVSWGLNALYGVGLGTLYRPTPGSVRSTETKNA